MLSEGTYIDPDESLAEREQGLCVLVRNLFLRRVGLKKQLQIQWRVDSMLVRQLSSWRVYVACTGCVAMR